MNFKTIIFIFFSFFFLKCTDSVESTNQEILPSSGEALAESNSESDIINALISELNNLDTTALVERFEYPFYRGFTEDTIHTVEDMRSIIFQLFEVEFREKIEGSSIGNGWGVSESGNLLYDNFELVLNKDGNFLELNHLSFWDKLQKVKKEKREQDLLSLHESLWDFQTTIAIRETENYKIRIDKISDKHFRFASWHKDSAYKTEPAVIVSKGNRIKGEQEGSDRYEFVGENVHYNYQEITNREETLPVGKLSIIKGDSVIAVEETFPPSIIRFWTELMEHTEDKAYLGSHVNFPYQIGTKKITYNNFSRSNYTPLEFSDMKMMNYDPVFEKFNWDENSKVYAFITDHFSTGHVYSVRQKPVPDGFIAYFLLCNNTYYLLSYDMLKDYGEEGC